MNSIKNRIYDEISRLLTEYEQETATTEDLYNLLVEIQNNWEYITAQD